MKVLGILLSMFLVGCATLGRPGPPVFIPVHDDIPEPPVIEQPYLPIWLLDESDKNRPKKTAKAYSIALRMQMDHSAKLQCALDAYRTITPPQCPILSGEK